MNVIFLAFPFYRCFIASFWLTKHNHYVINREKLILLSSNYSMLCRNFYKKKFAFDGIGAVIQSRNNLSEWVFNKYTHIKFYQLYKNNLLSVSCGNIIFTRKSLLFRRRDISRWHYRVQSRMEYHSHSWVTLRITCLTSAIVCNREYNVVCPQLLGFMFINGKIYNGTVYTPRRTILD